MPPNPRSTEDRLTESLAQALVAPQPKRAFWELAAPSRIHGVDPIRFNEFWKLGPCKPDLLFFAGETALLYIEAKLAAQTEPLQLTRARSWMRRHGAEDDQVILLCNHIDQLIEEVGWPRAALPVKTLTWHSVLNAIAPVSRSNTHLVADRFRDFERTLAEYSGDPVHKAKTGMRSSIGHPFGATFHEFAGAREGIRSDFLYGARIDPRLSYGFARWADRLMSKDCERILLFYGCGGGSCENYRAQLILWHTSDYAESSEGPRRHWHELRKAIIAEPLAEFEWGGRQHSARTRGVPPVQFPDSLVGLVNLPTSQIGEMTFRRFSRPELLQKLNAMVAPLERILDRFAGVK